MMIFDPTFAGISANTLPNRNIVETWLNWISPKLVAFQWLKNVNTIFLCIWSSSHFFSLSSLCLNLELSLIWFGGSADAEVHFIQVLSSDSSGWWLQCPTPGAQKVPPSISV